MRTKTRKGTVAVAAILAMALTVGFWAACGTSDLVANYATGAQLNVPGTLDDGSGIGTIQTRFWMQGQSALHNSGDLETIYQVMNWNGSDYYIWSNWGDARVVGDCPPSDGRMVFLYSIENGGAGQYIFMTSGKDTTTTWAWDFDAVTNGNGDLGPNTETPMAIPAVTVDSQSSAGGVMDLVLSWPSIQNLKGFYDTDPGRNLITGAVVRYTQGASAPTSFKTADWNVAGVVNFGEQGSDPGLAEVQIPDAPGMTTYVALSLLFDGGQPGGFTETIFVGESAEVRTAPVCAAEFGSLSAVHPRHSRTVDVSFTMTTEQGVESYTIEGGRSVNGSFRALTTISADGSGAYSATVSGKGVKAVRVRATLKDGSEVISEAATVQSAKGLKNRR